MMSEDVTDLFDNEGGDEEPLDEEMEFGDGPAADEADPDDVATAWEEPTTSSTRFETGIEELDRAMSGGVPPSRLVVMVTSPGVQSDLLLNRLLAQRDTLLVSTDRPEWEVTKDIEPGIGTGRVIVRSPSPEELLASPSTVLDELPMESNLIVDSINELELVDRDRYRDFVSTVKRTLFDTGSVGLFFGVTVDHETARDLTLRRADIVWRLQTTTADTELENRLFVPKFRGGAALTDAVKLELTDEVAVDTSRDIA